MQAVAPLPLNLPRAAFAALLGVLLALAGCSLLWAVDPALAQKATPTPSAAQELWDAYPLNATPTPATITAAAQSPAAEERKVSAPAAPADDDGSAVPPVLAGLVLALGAAALLWTFRPGRTRRRSGAPAIAVAGAPGAASLSATPALGAAKVGGRQASPARPAVPGPGARPRRAETLLLSAADPPAAGGGNDGRGAHAPLDRPAPIAPIPPATPAPSPPAPIAANPPVTPAPSPPAPITANPPAPIAANPPAAAAPSRPRAAPPDPRRAWSAEIAWAGSEGEPRFAALARSGQDEDPTIVAESPPLQWPPVGPAAVQALTDAVTELESALLAAGWIALEPGSAWYAKRFGWRPKTPVAATAGRKPAKSGRFDRNPAWPPGAEELWRCELRWDAGVVKSRFEAVAYEPGSERPARPVAGSAPFKWLMLADPDPAADEFRAELQKLALALEAAGWEPAGRGAKWYAARIVWRRDKPPPERVEPPAPWSRQTVEDTRRG